MVLSVADNGIDIDAQDIALAIEPFGQAGSARNSASGGTGLGLALTAALAEFHQARLDVYSTLGIGALGTVTFPAARAISAAA